MADTAMSDGTMPCPVPSPGGLPCAKRIPKGWTASEGHGGGHWWISPELDEAMAAGRYDATLALTGQPFTAETDDGTVLSGQMQIVQMQIVRREHE